MRVSRLTSVVLIGLVLCALALTVAACSSSGTKAPTPPSAEPQGQLPTSAPSGGGAGAVTGIPVPPGITGSKYAGMQVVGYLGLRGGEWAVYDADPGSGDGANASPLATLAPGKVSRAAIEALDGRYIVATGTPSPGGDVPQIKVDGIQEATELR